MRILILGYTPSPLEEAIILSGCSVASSNAPLDDQILSQSDFIISYGYRHIIKQNVLDRFPSRIINLHVSYLPWNRGADPNLWSFLEDTPKGITIHYMDAGIDTGDIIHQEEVEMGSNETLGTSYAKLQDAMLEAFKRIWPSIMNGTAGRHPQKGKGTYHRLADKAPYAHLWSEQGWNTPVKRLAGKASLTGRKK